ncbi:hypothetical protein FUA23_00415 [Neolewinella aurantiaca]|uniref:Uncharacterized protein n=1 Tax=Neolewinella aurantiaca TaxID=2602767 RepID=A0A5C7FXY6_9BACT|nr:hypothetical protein [Neolewinella aurantiaca]TXF91681.1 hypothetical protein FUA23_00415 [Neolewinella aurantiaca]
MKITLLSVFTCLALGLCAQANLDAEFRFPEGVYLSHASLLANEPDLKWEAIDGEMVQLPEDFRVQIADYGYKDVRINADIIPYAISLDGLPYLFVKKNNERGYYEFAGLRVLGTLSTIRYDTTITTRRLMKAYNPANGQPFRQAYVEREKTVPLNKILDLRSGALYPFDQPTLLLLCAEDEELVTALKVTDPADEQMLLRALKLYDDRHPLSLPLR